MLITYKVWKSLNESIMPSFNLGLSNPSNLGISSQFGFEESKMPKKKSKKKMDGDEDGEIVDASATKDEPEVDVSSGEDSEGGCGKMCGKMSKKKSKKKMWGDEDDAAPASKCGSNDDESEDEGDEEGEDDVEEKSPKKPMMFSKKSKKKMCGDEMQDDEGDDEEMQDDGDEEGEGDEEIMKGKMMSKKKMKKESTEEEKWWDSVKGMVNTDLNQKYSSGCEDLFTKIDTENLTQAVRGEK